MDLTRRVHESFAPKPDVIDGGNAAGVVEEETVTTSVSEALNTYRRQLRGIVSALRTQWEAAKADQTATNWPMIAGSLEADLLEIQTQLVVYLDDPTAAVVKDLGIMIANAHILSEHRFFIDGGRSYRVFTDAMDRLLDALEKLTGEDWASYVVTQLPVGDDPAETEA